MLFFKSNSCSFIGISLERLLSTRLFDCISHRYESSVTASTSSERKEAFAELSAHAVPVEVSVSCLSLRFPGLISVCPDKKRTLFFFG